MAEEEGVGYESGDYEQQQAQPEADAWSAPEKEWYQNMDSFVQQAGPILNQLAQVMNEPDDEDQQGYYYQQQYDPTFDPERAAYEQQQQQELQGYIGQQIQDALGPWEPLLGQVAQSQGEQLARTALDGLGQELGPFNHDRAVLSAVQYMEQGYDPEQALRQAATDQVAFEKEIREAAIREYEEKRKAVAAAPVEPAAGQGSAAEVRPMPRGPDRYERLAQEYFQNRDLQPQ